MKFVKMNGLGNDFVVFKGPLAIEPKVIAKLCDRHFGIGADGLLIVSAGDVIKMDYWNADGTQAEMCGNGLRCVTRFAVDNKMAAPGDFRVQTPNEILKVSWDGNDEKSVSGQVGKVIIEPEPISLKGYDFHKASVGNPHAITFVDDVSTAPVTALGPEIETDQHFPNKTNVEFVQVESRGKINLRIWERGVGETMACGTGMVSTAMVCQNLDKTDFPTTLQVPGGSAEAWVDDEGYACLKGPAVYSFVGEIDLENL